MSISNISYDNFDIDWWNTVGVAADSIKAGIAEIIESTFGTGITVIQKQGLIDSSFESFKSQQALKEAGKAAIEAAKWSDVPDSPMYKNAIATKETYERLAISSSKTAEQIMQDTGGKLALASKLEIGKCLGPIINAAQLSYELNKGDSYEIGKAATSILAGMAIGGAVALALATAPAIIAGTGVAAACFIGSKFGGWFWNNALADLLGVKKGDQFWDNLFSFFTSAQNFIYRSDPLTLDLDGDGIETSAASSTNPVMFDYNGDGTKTSTGWIKSDDGMLVLDRNGNGTIDNASELFSDYSPLANGSNAANGFAALSQEDTNNDGVVNNLDANWNNLKVWQDANSDGISQADELHTMDETGITGINVARTNTTQTLANGNSIKGTGTFTKADGTTGNMGDVYLKVDTTTQQFTDTVTVSPEAEAMPDMSGSGMVRNLHEAASLSPALQTILTQYSQAATRNEQLAIIDQLLDAWADTSGMAETMEEQHIEYLRRAA